MSWIHRGKLERLAMFCHFAVAFQESFPKWWGSFISPRSAKPCSPCTAPFWRQSHWVIVALWQADRPCQGVHKSAVIIISSLVPLKLRYTPSRPEPAHQQSSWLSLPLWWRCIHSLLSVLELHRLRILRPMVLPCSLLFCCRSPSSNSSKNMQFLLVIDWCSFLTTWALALAVFELQFSSYRNFFCWFLSKNTTPYNTYLC